MYRLILKEIVRQISVDRKRKKSPKSHETFEIISEHSNLSHTNSTNSFCIISRFTNNIGEAKYKLAKAVNSSIGCYMSEID